MSRQPARPSPSSRSSHSRRRLLALAASSGLFATSGCLSALGSSGESNDDVGLSLDRLEYREGFESEADSLASTYGRYGVWGLADGPGLDGPTYVGAYRDSLVVPADRDDGIRWVTADFAAVVYRLPDAYRVWLWAGGRARQPDSGLGRSSLTRLSLSATAGEGWTLADFAPRGAVREGPVPVGLDDRGPSGRTPLPGGGIGVDEGTGTGPGGRVRVSWQGIARGTRSVNAVCAFRRAIGADDRPFAARLSAGVAGGRGAL